MIQTLFGSLEPQEPSFFDRMKQAVTKTRESLAERIDDIVSIGKEIDRDTLDDLEATLIAADLGTTTTHEILQKLRDKADRKQIKDVAELKRLLKEEIAGILTSSEKPPKTVEQPPEVILVVGVNGTGKTTTIGKLASKLSGSGLKVMLAAGDTFRAAAIEQLKIWADRTGSQFIGTKLGADASGLAYDAYEQARAQKSDVLIIDTAGRLQNKTELMAELEKIVRVLGKLDPDAPHTVLQTLDATTGQNALNQVEIFRNVAGVSGLIMTKLDGTARGGILVAIAAKHKLPVYFIGVGEGVDDLEPFEAEDFAKAIAGV